MIVSPFLSWTQLADDTIFFGALDRLEAAQQSGWERAPLASAIVAAAGTVLVGGGLRVLRLSTWAVPLAVAAALAAVSVVVIASDEVVQSSPALVVRVSPGAGCWLAWLGGSLAGLGRAVRPKGDSPL